MKKKNINCVMTIISVVYLILFIVVAIKSKISNETFDIFDTDGLTIIGSIFALAELLISNKNKLSTQLNKIIFCNKMVSYKINITMSSQKLQIKDFIDILEHKICEYMEVEELKRKPTSKLQSIKWTLLYEQIGCEIACYSHVYDSYNSMTYGLTISGRSKYGKISSRRKDILYFSLLVKLLANDYLVDSYIMQNTKVERVEIILNRQGSQITSSNIFSETIKNVESYNIKTLDGLKDKEEIYLNEQEIKWTTLNSRTLIDGFENLTNILCSIE